MARAILALVFTAARIAWAAESCSPPPDTPAATQTEIANLQKNTQEGPFYRELIRKFRNPPLCKLDLGAGAISITYSFPDRNLQARINRGIESSELILTLPGLTMKTALELLQKAEKAAYPPRGCQIAWKSPKTENSQPPGHREIVHRGAACNCQAGILFDYTRIVALVLQSAC